MLNMTLGKLSSEIGNTFDLKQTAVPTTPANPNSTNYDEEFPPLQIPALRRSTCIANKKKVTFGKHSIIHYFE